jgi:hypothetical protein
MKHGPRFSSARHRCAPATRRLAGVGRGVDQSDSGLNLQMLTRVWPWIVAPDFSDCAIKVRDALHPAEGVAALRAMTSLPRLHIIRTRIIKFFAANELGGNMRLPQDRWNAGTERSFVRCSCELYKQIGDLS